MFLYAGFYYASELNLAILPVRPSKFLIIVLSYAKTTYLTIIVFHFVKILDQNSTNLDQFLQSMMVEKTSGVLFWLHMLHKLIKASAGLFTTTKLHCYFSKIIMLE